MKSRSILLLASAGLAMAHPSQGAQAHHNHKRWHELKARQATETTVVSTVSVYELNGKVISYEELQQGLKNGTLVLDGDAPAPSPQIEKKVQAASSAPAPPVVIQAPSSSTTPATTAQAPPSTTASPAAASSAAPSKAPAQNKAVQQSNNGPSYGGNGGSGGYGSGTGSGLTRDYDNSLSCDQFPSEFGAIPVPYLGNNGWLAVMQPGAGSSSSSYDNLATGGSCTTEGAFCSYACPAGWEKTQWPEAQGATGQSVGGLQCKGGKLVLTRPEVPNLCSNSMQKAQISIRNNLSKQVAVCRTDYPGTENMNIPLSLQPDQSSDIACPDADTAYKWQGKSTSAQYYVNPAGVSVENACQWGSPANPWGNWAPANLGVGYSNGNAWISVFPNLPTQPDSNLGFTIRIEGDIIGKGCTWNGGAGCTVTVPTGGKATFVFEDA